jgi:hypothetical protein
MKRKEKNTRLFPSKLFARFHRAVKVRTRSDSDSIGAERYSPSCQCRLHSKQHGISRITKQTIKRHKNTITPSKVGQVFRRRLLVRQLQHRLVRHNSSPVKSKLQMLFEHIEYCLAAAIVSPVYHLITAQSKRRHAFLT